MKVVDNRSTEVKVSNFNMGDTLYCGTEYYMVTYKRDNNTTTVNLRSGQEVVFANYQMVRPVELEARVV